eukprot:1137566-Pelagomonas_calceolata.AAC.4
MKSYEEAFCPAGGKGRLQKQRASSHEEREGEGNAVFKAQGFLGSTASGRKASEQASQTTQHSVYTSSTSLRRNPVMFAVELDFFFTSGAHAYGQRATTTTRKRSGAMRRDEEVRSSTTLCCGVNSSQRSFGSSSLCFIVCRGGEGQGAMSHKLWRVGKSGLFVAHKINLLIKLQGAEVSSCNNTKPETTS